MWRGPRRSSIHLFIFVLGRLCLILLFPTLHEADGRKRSAVCYEEEEEEEGEEEEGVPPTEHKRSSKNQRMAHVPPPCRSACRGTELTPCRVVPCRRAVSQNWTLNKIWKNPPGRPTATGWLSFSGTRRCLEEEEWEEGGRGRTGSRRRRRRREEGGQSSKIWRRRTRR